ncbi:FxsB family cyclophane-forming radical SAM/SPASM peptide maturase [Streptomyces boninensis]|uniref:FxsB family cyclophane-forming radical SAM/SPASM peptide maturase n=1 Tax=Streptomyces boninensis TaxID=2039455 RepID=UPI003B2118B0
MPPDADSGDHADAFRQFVLKVHSRCNLACTYCYVYRGADDSWRRRPHRASGDVMHRTAAHIAEHAAAHRLPEVRIELHGGEPLLGGPGQVLAYAEAVRAAAPPGCAVAATVQTNGTLLTPATLDALAVADIRIGLSLDGGTARLNRRRTDHAARPSWPAAHRAARLLAERPAAWAGLLCAVDIAADPVEVYDSLAALQPPMLDLLLPHATWATPPPRPQGSPDAYGQWLATAFDRWWHDGPAAPRIRLFHEILALLLGAPSTAETVGLAPSAAVVVDTDGAIEQTDTLKSAHQGAAATGLDVFRHSFDAAATHAGVAARRHPRRALADACRACPVGEVCGGGHYAHRYHPAHGFTHRSVYCADLEYLIRHIAARLAESGP